MIGIAMPQHGLGLPNSNQFYHISCKEVRSTPSDGYSGRSTGHGGNQS